MESVTSSSPTPRQLFSEHLISQNRNSTVDGQVRNQSIKSKHPLQRGGTMDYDGWSNLYGWAWCYPLQHRVYEQNETFLTLPNVIFQVLSANTSYSADTSGNVP